MNRDRPVCRIKRLKLLFAIGLLIIVPIESTFAQLEPIEVSGTVVDDETGRGVPDATVVVSFSVRDDIRLGKSRREQRVVATDADGRFRFVDEAPRMWTTTVFGSAVDLDVVKQGYARHRWSRDVDDVSPVAIQRRCRFATVLDADGRPLVGARVSGASSLRDVIKAAGRSVDSFSGVSDKEGRVRLSWAHPDRSAGLRVEHPRVGSQFLSIDQAAHSVRCRPVALVEVRCVDEDDDLASLLPDGITVRSSWLNSEPRSETGIRQTYGVSRGQLSDSSG